MKPYYQDDHCQLFVGDWRELIAPDFRADLILTDPPYGETSLAWDRWPVGWPELAARHSDAMWCFGSMRMFLDRRDEFAAWKLSQDVVWEKNTTMFNLGDRFSRCHEHALHWYRGQWSAIHHEPSRVPAETRKAGDFVRSSGSEIYGGLGMKRRQIDGLAFQRSVMRSRSVRDIAPTQKPTPLLEPLLTYGCPPGGVVLDLFAGSCSTGVAAKRAGRRAVLYELREEQAELAARRLAQDVLNFEEPA